MNHSSPDPLRVQILWDRLLAVVEEQAPRCSDPWRPWW